MSTSHPAFLLYTGYLSVLELILKLLLLLKTTTFKAQNGLAPNNISDLLRSSDATFLVVPKTRLKSKGETAEKIRMAKSFFYFKSLLKTHFFIAIIIII